jgi:hypothetical protein
MIFFWIIAGLDREHTHKMSISYGAVSMEKRFIVVVDLIML